MLSGDSHNTCAHIHTHLLFYFLKKVPIQGPRVVHANQWSLNCPSLSYDQHSLLPQSVTSFSLCPTYHMTHEDLGIFYIWTAKTHWAASIMSVISVLGKNTNRHKREKPTSFDAWIPKVSSTYDLCLGRSANTVPRTCSFSNEKVSVALKDYRKSEIFTWGKNLKWLQFTGHLFPDINPSL